MEGQEVSQEVSEEVDDSCSPRFRLLVLGKRLTAKGFRGRKEADQVRQRVTVCGWAALRGEGYSRMDGPGGVTALSVLNTYADQHPSTEYVQE